MGAEKDVAAGVTGSGDAPPAAEDTAGQQATPADQGTPPAKAERPAKRKQTAESIGRARAKLNADRVRRGRPARRK